MSSEGETSTRKRSAHDEDVPTEAEPGRLTLYYERIAGVLERLISLHGTDALDQPRSDPDKAEFGDRAPR